MSEKDSMDKVLVAYPHGQSVDSLFHASMLRVMYYDLNHNQRLLHPDGDKLNIDTVSMGPMVPAARNELVRRFLTTELEWMLFIDTDMYFTNTAIDELMAVADPIQAPIVSGYCMTVHQVGQYTDEFYTLPTVYFRTDNGDVARPTEEDVAKLVAATGNPVLETDATGCAFLLVHRSVYEKMREEDPEMKAGRPKFYIWFYETERDGAPTSEDISFCARAQELGIPKPRVHTGVRVLHRKAVAL